ncbi:hypothetical protein GGI07_000865 [Coemansia sp. Benny D115]|nr:hypothetical protein GGI07_000865 [Coemansia sp. Benny D115]
MSSQWVPDWPEPDDDHVMALLRRRPSGLALDLGRPSSISSSIDDPLTVWPREALVLQASGVPRGATNLWLRRHAWQLPLDPLFVAQWALSSTLSISYMIGVRPLAVAADSAGVTGHTSAFVSVLGYTAIFSAHALSLAASIVDPQAPEVLAQQMPRNPNYVQTWGVPVIDPATLLGAVRVESPVLF